ncbi:MAG: hypothetical protein ABJB76_00020 [Candidatus Nitrosocosmicus sp.]
MSNTSQNSENENNSNKEKQKVSQYSEIITKLVEKLVSKDVSVTYTFDNLEIDIPSAHGPGGKELGGAKWVIDGKITISTTSAATHNDGSSSNSSKYVTA